MQSRTKNTKRNIIWSYVDYIITVIFQFVSRTVIVYTLGAEYLGLSSLFTSILQVLSMAELGFSSAIVYNMYKPIAENDKEKVCALLAYYKNIYRIVGSVIIIVGLAIMPFLPHLITGGYPSNINLYILYLLYLINTGISYFLFAYKTSLLNALQRLDLMKIAYCTVNIIQYILQIVALLVLRNYYIFVIFLIFGTAFKNIVAAYVAKKRFPEYFCAGHIDKETKKNVISKVKGLLIGSISGITYTTLDSIIISAYIGLSTVAVYNNYLTIQHSVLSIILLIRNAMQASVGNSVASESIEKNYSDIKKWQFLFSMIGLWCSTCTLCLYQPFMVLWMGDGMLLSSVDVVLLSFLIYLNNIQHAFYLYLSACGLWWEVKWAYILSTVCNLALNILLCRFWGTTGIIMATFIASCIFGSVWQCIVVFRKYFKRSAKEYFFRQIGYFGLTIISWIISYFTCNMLHAENIIGLFTKLLICTGASTGIMFICFRKTKVYSESRSVLMHFIHR